MKLILALTATPLLTAPTLAAPCEMPRASSRKARLSPLRPRDQRCEGKRQFASGPKKGQFTKCR
jgi:hypothetical protein